MRAPLLLAAVLAGAILGSEAQSCSPTCQNGGMCLFSLSSGTSTCNCAGTGYTGNDCSIAAGTPSNTTAPSPSTTQTQNCSGLPCYYGSCTAQYNAPLYVCSCQPGYSGTFCNVTSAAAPAPSTTTTSSTNQSCPIACINGLCTPQYDSGNIANGYVCQCFAGYSGTSCRQSSAAIAPASVGCSSGCSNGQCLAFANGTSHCQCNLGYTGVSCSQRAVAGSTESSSSSGGSGLSGGAIFGIVLVVMVVTILAAAGGFLLWRRRRRETFVRFQDGQLDGQQSVEISHQKMGSGRF